MSEFGGFNAHELLSRLRSGSNPNQFGSSSSVGGLSIASSTNSQSQQQQQIRRNESANSNSNVSMSGPYSIPMQTSELQQQPFDPIHPNILSRQPNYEASSQRRENMEIRVELEKEIKRLQDQVSQLKAENKALRSANSDLELKMSTMKQKSDDVIASLRGKLVKADAIKKTNSTPTSAIASAGPRIGPTRHSGTSAPGTRSRHPPNLTTGPTTYDGNERKAHGFNGREEDESVQLGAGTSNFAGPTFNELIRRSTAPDNDFNEILRKPHLSTGYTNGSIVGRGVASSASKTNSSAGPVSGPTSVAGNSAPQQYGASNIDSAAMNVFQTVGPAVSGNGGDAMLMSDFESSGYPSQPQLHANHYLLQQQQQQQQQHLYQQQMYQQQQHLQYLYGDPGTPYLADSHLPPAHTPSQAQHRVGHPPVPAPGTGGARWDMRRGLSTTDSQDVEHGEEDDGEELPVVEIDLR